MIKSIVTLLMLIYVITGQANEESPYRGQQSRDIKSLSQSEIDGYLNGKGMGFAKAAELNHYPGPRHVLDLASELKLDKRQQEQTQALFDRMQTSAIELGKQLVSQERKLDQLFANNQIDRENLDAILQEIGSTKAKLRYIHLSTHLEQKLILNEHQIMMYDKLRGYTGNNDSRHNSDHKHNHSH